MMTENRMKAFIILLIMGISPLARGAAPSANTTTPLDEPLDPPTLRQAIEDDWLRQVEAWRAGNHPLTTAADAAGGCDGVKDGKYGFHVGLTPNPWWQVDLGASVALARIVIYNRLDYAPGLHNADIIQILTSDDGKAWTLRHDNKGKHFGGVRGGAPLEAQFPPGLRARFVRLRLPSAKPIFMHLDEVEIYGPEDARKNLALHRPADQSSLCQWSTVKSQPGEEKAETFPIPETLAHGRRLAEALAKMGVDAAPALAELGRIEKLNAAKPGAAEARALYLQAHWAIRRLAFANPLLNFDRMIFVKRHTQQSYPDVCLNHMPWVSAPGGDLCVLSGGEQGALFKELGEPGGTITSTSTSTKRLEGLNVKYLINGALGPGHVHGMDLWFGGDRVVFGYARAASAEPPAGWLDRTQSYRLRRSVEPIHIFEMNLAGGGVRQLTHGEWSDLDPTYAPNGDIVFVSERCGTSLQCNEYDKDETSCNLYVMRPDGSGVRRMSANKDGDYLPHTLDDGTIAYTRWEYHERSWAFIQSIWIVRPDGTGADAVFKQHFTNPWALEETRSIPGSRKLVAIAAGHHTLPVGPLVVVTHGAGVNTTSSIQIITPGVKPPEGGMEGVPVAGGGVLDAGGFYASPWALSEQFFLASYNYGKQGDPDGYGLYLVDAFGNKELIYRDPAISCFAALPLRPRPHPPVLPDRTDPARPFAICAVTSASFGAEGVDPRQARYLRIAEPIGWPYDNTRGGQRYGEDHRYPGPDGARKNLLSWTPIRVLGDVPIAPDGSAHFAVPADTAVYFQLLDENRMELRRMRSFISFQPGERRGCVGCHETRTIAPPGGRSIQAFLRPPALPEPPPWGADRPVSFLRDIQPIFDLRCAGCHAGLKPAGGLDFSGGLTTFDKEIPGYGFNRAYQTLVEHGLVAMSAVRAQDASITPPLAYGSPKSKLVATLRGEGHAGRVRLTAEEWRRLLTWIDANAPYHDDFVNKREAVPAYDLALDRELEGKLHEIHARRCAACHAADAVTRLDWIDLHAPARSRFLEAPLARAAGGSGRCGGEGYKDAGDRDYRAALGLVNEAVKKSWERPRRDLKTLKDDAANRREAAGGVDWRTAALNAGPATERIH